MADTRSQKQEAEGNCALPEKRKRDLVAVTAEEGGGELPSKASKNGAFDCIGDSQNAKSAHGGDNANGQENNRVPEASDAVEARLGEGMEGDEDDEEYEDEEESDEEDEDDDDEEEEEEERPVDLKGKGILKDDKGKGKVIVEDDDDSDDVDLSDGGEVGSDSDSDLSDDPLAEVDLDNILPSRTRRSRTQPGLSIGGDRRNSSHGGDGNA